MERHELGRGEEELCSERLHDIHYQKPCSIIEIKAFGRVDVRDGGTKKAAQTIELSISYEPPGCNLPYPKTSFLNIRKDLLSQHLCITPWT